MRKMWKCQNEIRLNFAERVREVCVCVEKKHMHKTGETKAKEIKKEGKARQKRRLVEYAGITSLYAVVP